MDTKRQRTSNGPPKATLVYEGCANFRQRLVLACITSRPVRIVKIRPDDECPGLASFEASFVRLLDKLTNGTSVEINEVGTTLSFRPGIIIGGSIDHDCCGDQNDSRSVGWFLEGILPMAPFAKKPFQISFDNCITNDEMDPSVDMIKEVAFPILRRFGVANDEETNNMLSLQVKSRGARPLGGGVVEFRCSTVRELIPIDWIDAGLIKRVRGVAYSTKVSPQVANRCIFSSRGILNNLLPDVYVFSDVYSGKTSGKSPGFGVLLTAESNTGSMICAEVVAEVGTLPEDVGESCAQLLLQEVMEGGCVDSTHQPLVLMMMALGPEDVTRIRVGKLTQSAMGTLRLLRDFLGVTFKVKPDIGDANTVLLSCLGCGYKNVAKQVT
mmetsp:Transcript_37436/g.48434  ORF Transcript_37436/g.48434 Transcript_37436/m.48434 type:complete len:383 (+) Transcript_37436:16-1164(+)